ncbi:hypothetical protein [Protofrankia symbiont of Coriaria ruscifolia]|uniref:Uncharacterized protein n=1 Tax=Candidatus Protofrankia californiensis TaxID=1839754 RepID=A0A1C3P1G6_9ACTN|nr:hypothetical protein [Protofrankia symbiont of Coriaria ruscifolia]SBW23653.1 hypothetical protein FDG2_3871 [Candidatus Protofrankia californiensis]
MQTDDLNGEVTCSDRLYSVPTPVNALLQRLTSRTARDSLPPGLISSDEFLAEVSARTAVPRR